MDTRRKVDGRQFISKILALCTSTFLLLLSGCAIEESGGWLTPKTTRLTWDTDFLKAAFYIVGALLAGAGIFIAGFAYLAWIILGLIMFCTGGGHFFDKNECDKGVVIGCWIFLSLIATILFFATSDDWPAWVRILVKIGLWETAVIIVESILVFFGKDAK